MPLMTHLPSLVRLFCFLIKIVATSENLMLLQINICGRTIAGNLKQHLTFRNIIIIRNFNTWMMDYIYHVRRETTTTMGACMSQLIAWTGK